MNPNQLDVAARRKFYSVLLALSTIVLPGIMIAMGMGFMEFCEPCLFILYGIPFGIGYGGGSDFTIILYYLALFILLTLVIYLIIRPQNISK